MLPFCPYHFVCAILSNTILSGHRTLVYSSRRNVCRRSVVDEMSVDELSWNPVRRQCIHRCNTKIKTNNKWVRFLWFHDNSSTTLRLQTFRLLLYTSVQDSYTSNFCFRKSLFSSIPTATYTMIPFYQSCFH